MRHYCFQARGRVTFAVLCYMDRAICLLTVVTLQGEGGGESASKGRATDSVAAEAYDSSDEDRSDPPAKRVSVSSGSGC